MVSKESNFLKNPRVKTESKLYYSRKSNFLFKNEKLMTMTLTKNKSNLIPS